MFNRIKDYFNSVDLGYSVVENATIIMFGYTSKANYQCVVDVNEEDKIVIVYMTLGHLVPLEKRNKMAQFISRINFGLKLGNFEMDYEDGQIRYKTSIDYEGVKEFEDIFIENLILSGLTATDLFYNSIEEVLYSRKSIEKILNS